MPERKPASQTVGAARAAIGQGLGMGWGDEAEAWLRSKLPGSKGYDAELAQINREYAQYSQENPFVAPALEFTGGMLPVVASLAVPGSQAAAPATALRAAGALNRLRAVAANPVARTVATGATTGAISGAGSAQPGERGTGAATGAIIGTGVGLAAPAVIRGGGAATRWLRDRVAPTEELITERAAGKVNKALQQSGMTPQQAADVISADRARNIPSTLANVSRPTVGLAETAAQRSGTAPDIIEEALDRQRLGSRERAYTQAKQGIGGGNYYDDLKKLQSEMRLKADPLYKQAYSYGEVTDPEVLKFLELPQFKQGIKEAEELLSAEGRQLDLYREMIDPTTGEKVKQFVPTVETLDQVKRGIDRLIENETDSVTDKVSALGRVYTLKKNEFLNALDSAVPDFAKARAVYRGDAEIADAMRKGMQDFGKLDHEQVINLTKDMGPAELDAFRTGVVRDIYSRIMKPSGNVNAAQRIIGAPEMQAKLQPLFDSPAKFELFKSALERESQLFQQSNRILGGSATGRRTAAREAFEEGPGVGQMVGDAITGGFWGSLSQMASRVARSATMTDEIAEKTAKLLMSSEPAEVAAAVKLLETEAEKAIPKATAVTRKELGLTTGTTAAFPSPPIDETMPEANIEADMQPTSMPSDITGPDIEADIERMERNSRAPGPAMVKQKDLSDPNLR